MAKPDARANILARIRAAQGRSGTPSAAELDEVESYIQAKPRGPVRPLTGDLVAQFRAGAESMQCTTECVAIFSVVPAAAARYLRSNQLPSTGCMTPELAHLDWKSAGLELQPRPAVDTD